MKELTAPQLTDLTKPWGIVRFRHKDGKIHKFYSVINEMSGSRLSAFDSDAPGVNDEMAWIKSVFKDIHKKATEVEYKGTIKFK